MKTYTVEVVQIVKVTLDETKFTPDFFGGFNTSISDWGDDLERHANHLAWVHASGVEDLSYARQGPFVEGYGPVHEMGVKAATIETDTQVIEVTP